MLGFIKASELVESLPDSGEVSGSSMDASLPTSFVPASKLVSAVRTVTKAGPLVLDDAVEDLSQSKREREKEILPFGPTEFPDKDTHAHQTSSTGVGGLKRVKIDPSDLYEDDPTSSEEESLPGPSVSGPGMSGFQLASSLSLSSLPLQSGTVSSDRESSVALSVRPSVAVETSGRGKGGKFASGQAKPLPKITSFFEKYIHTSVPIYKLR